MAAGMARIVPHGPLHRQLAVVSCANWQVRTTKFWAASWPLRGWPRHPESVIIAPMPVDPEFGRPALVERIVRGTTESDRVRLHGAIVAALELYGRDDALREVFTPALRQIRREHGRAARDRASAAIRDQLGPGGGYHSPSS
jgi:hypothetical protein